MDNLCPIVSTNLSGQPHSCGLLVSRYLIYSGERGQSNWLEHLNAWKYATQKQEGDIQFSLTILVFVVGHGGSGGCDVFFRYRTYQYFQFQSSYLETNVQSSYVVFTRHWTLFMLIKKSLICIEPKYCSFTFLGISFPLLRFCRSGTLPQIYIGQFGRVDTMSKTHNRTYSMSLILKLVDIDINFRG